MNRSLIFVLSAISLVALCATAPGADENAGAFQIKGGSIGAKIASEQKPANLRGAMKSGFSMLLGSISKIDTADPSNIKIEVNSEPDNRLHTVEITPATSVTKVTDISELKAGDTVRIMARRADNKEVAVGVMFGKLKK